MTVRDWAKVVASTLFIIFVAPWIGMAVIRYLFWVGEFFPRIP